MSTCPSLQLPGSASSSRRTDPSPTPLNITAGQPEQVMVHCWTLHSWTSFRSVSVSSLHSISFDRIIFDNVPSYVALLRWLITAKFPRHARLKWRVSSAVVCLRIRLTAWYHMTVISVFKAVECGGLLHQVRQGVPGVNHPDGEGVGP